MYDFYYSGPQVARGNLAIILVSTLACDATTKLENKNANQKCYQFESLDTVIKTGITKCLLIRRGSWNGRCEMRLTIKTEYQLPVCEGVSMSSQAKPEKKQIRYR